MEYPLDDKIKTLYIDKGYSEKEVAKQLGISENTVIQSLIRLGLYYGCY